MILDGRELAEFIKERQAKDVRRLRARKIWPKLAIVQVGDNAASASYIRSKQKYGADIGIAVDVHQADQPIPIIDKLNKDPNVHGIIVQLPLPEGTNTDEVLNSVAAKKDVDGLTSASSFDKPTPTAILWLLAGFNIDLISKAILIVGEGRLVGEPLAEILKQANYDVKTFNERSKDLHGSISDADIIITATGQPGLIKSDWIKDGTVVVDAGTSESGGKVVGDVEPALYERADIKVSPTPGGVGPLTVCALFDNVILAANGSISRT